MQLFDQRFNDNKANYIMQCVLATMTIFIVLMILDAIKNAAIIASLGASSFIAFGMPHAQVSRPRYLIGGYIIGIAVGCLCYYLSLTPIVVQTPVIQDSAYVIFGALAVGLAIFLMVITNTEHPPAAGLALGLVLHECSLLSIVVVSVGIVLLVIVKTMMKPVLINLL